MEIFHIEKGFPADLKLPKGPFLLKYTKHAQEAAKEDRYSKTPIILPITVDFEKADIFEVEMDNGVLIKLTCRFPHNDDYDLVMPIINDGKIVKTVWLNDKLDDHPTLDLSRYDSPKRL
jgi:hypothetical protein